MPKRSLTPSPSVVCLPAHKKRHTNDGAKSIGIKNFDYLIYDELALHIFSYLTAQELCRVQACNRTWARLSLDEQLWKGLYLGHFGRARLRGPRGFNTSWISSKHPERASKPLPERSKPSRPQFDWKWMYRVSSNWRNGRCRRERIRWSDQADDENRDNRNCHPTQILIAGELILSTTSGSFGSPKFRIHGLQGESHIVASKKHHSERLSLISCMVQDQSMPMNSSDAESSIKVAIIYNTGAISLFRLRLQHPEGSIEEETYAPPFPSERTSPITMAAYRHPLLITLSASFHLSLYQVSEGIVSHKQTLSSLTSYPPYSLVLSHPFPQTYKLLISYTVPIYPAHWGPAATELFITAGTGCVSSTKTYRAFDIPFGWLDDAQMAIVREQWSRKVSEVVATETDGKWVVLVGTNNIIQVYRIAGRPAPGRLIFVRSLHGHSCGIHSIALSDGRCVTIGKDGSVWVWDLEGDWSVEVRGGSVNFSRGGHVVFDERRILCSNQEYLEISHFDI